MPRLEAATRPLLLGDSLPFSSQGALGPLQTLHQDQHLKLTSHLSWERDLSLLETCPEPLTGPTALPLLRTLTLEGGLVAEKDWEADNC